MGKVSRMRALVVASGLVVLLFGSPTPSAACDSQNCDSRLVVAQAQTTTQTAQAAQPVATGKPVSLKRFTKAKSRSARNVRKSAVAQRAEAARKAKEAAARESAKAATAKKVTPAIANANAELLEGTETAPPARAGDRNQPPAANAAPTESTQVVAADEFNDIDKAAWDTAQAKPAHAALLDSRAEMREDDSKWAQTSTIGKIFVVFGALLTIGSAVRMFFA